MLVELLLLLLARSACTRSGEQTRAILAFGRALHRQGNHITAYVHYVYMYTYTSARCVFIIFLHQLEFSVRGGEASFDLGATCKDFVCAHFCLGGCMLADQDACVSLCMRVFVVMYVDAYQARMNE